MTRQSPGTDTVDYFCQILGSELKPNGTILVALTLNILLMIAAKQTTFSGVVCFW